MFRSSVIIHRFGLAHRFAPHTASDFSKPHTLPTLCTDFLPVAQFYLHPSIENMLRTLFHVWLFRASSASTFRHPLRNEYKPKSSSASSPSRCAILKQTRTWSATLRFFYDCLTSFCVYTSHYRCAASTLTCYITSPFVCFSGSHLGIDM